MRILVFGSSGNLGRALEAEAEARGWVFVGLCRGDGFDVMRDWVVDEPFDLVVFAQGIQQRLPIEEADEYLVQEILDVNLTGTLRQTIFLARDGLLAPGSLIVYCSSIQSSNPRKGRFVYAVAKGGLESLARGVTAELAPHSRAIALRLGQFTEQMKGIKFDAAETEELASRVPFGFVPPKEIAEFIFELYRFPHIAGTVIDMEGGHCLNIWP